MKHFFFFMVLGFALIFANTAMTANGVIVVPLGDDLYVLGSRSCNSSDVTLCTSEGSCTAAGGYWWSNNSCLGVPESETVVSADGRIWMDRNLGATQVATSLTDAAAYGDLYQWGRGDDGHQLRSSATISTTSSTDDPGHDDFITTNSPPHDWRVPQNDNLWQGMSGINNPCPAGFRIPTATELEIEIASWESNDSAGAFASPLKLVPPGYRGSSDGTVHNAGSNGSYWSSTVIGTGANALFVYIGDAYMSNFTRASGYSVRCIKD